MSKVGRWRMELQERPEYEAGRQDYLTGAPRVLPPGMTGDALEAWKIGWDDALLDVTERSPE